MWIGPEFSCRNFTYYPTISKNSAFNNFISSLLRPNQLSFKWFCQSYQSENFLQRFWQLDRAIQHWKNLYQASHFFFNEQSKLWLKMSVSIDETATFTNFRRRKSERLQVFSTLFFSMILCGDFLDSRRSRKRIVFFAVAGWLTWWTELTFYWPPDTGFILLKTRNRRHWFIVFYSFD